MDEAEEIPSEDSTRLDGYLRGRAEADLQKHLNAMREKMKLVEDNAR
jgi:hypothetical protein